MIKKYNITVNGVSYEVEVEELGMNSRPASIPQAERQVAPKSTANESKAVKPQVQAGGGSVVAPMPGTIIDVKVNSGQSVKKGDVLVILEAMKMENEIMAPNDGVVADIKTSKGAAVSSGDILVILK